MEKEFEELKELFQNKKTSTSISSEVMDKKANHDLLQLKKNHLKNIFMFITTAVVLIIINKINMGRIDISYSGFAILLGCAIYYAISKIFLLNRLNAINPTNDVLQTIRQLERYNKLNKIMHTYGEIIYLLVLNAGVYIYIRPVLDKIFLDISVKSTLFLILIWGSVILWMLFHTFCIKRRRMKKDIVIIESYLHSLETEIN